MSNAQANTVLDLRKLDENMLNDLFSELNSETKVESFKIIERHACGDGVASTADRINLQVSFSKNPHAIPEQLILKTLLLNPVLRLGLPAVLFLSTVVNVLEKIPLLGAAASRSIFLLVGVFQKYFPQASDAMYEIESRFYREIRPQLQFEAPKVYGSRYDHKSRQFAVLMEDLSLREAKFPSALESISLVTVKSTLQQMAKLHASYWQSEKLNTELNWVPTRMEGGMYPVFEGIGFDLIRYQVEQNAFKAQLIKPIGKTLNELWEAIWKSQQLLMEGPQTLLHGDTHVGNTYVLKNGEGGLIDFQLLVKGSWVIDICYYMITALDIESRRKHEKELYQYYLEQLASFGVKDVPTFDEAWHGHRLASIWGLVIGWLITPPVNYGEEITAANIERLAQAVIDLRAFEAISHCPNEHAELSEKPII